jgi:hypothetical protein
MCLYYIASLSLIEGGKNDSFLWAENKKINAVFLSHAKICIFVAAFVTTGAGTVSLFFFCCFFLHRFK